MRKALSLLGFGLFLGLALSPLALAGAWVATGRADGTTILLAAIITAAIYGAVKARAAR